MLHFKLKFKILPFWICVCKVLDKFIEHGLFKLYFHSVALFADALMGSVALTLPCCCLRGRCLNMPFVRQII